MDRLVVYFFIIFSMDAMALVPAPRTGPTKDNTCFDWSFERATFRGVLQSIEASWAIKTYSWSLS